MIADVIREVLGDHPPAADVRAALDGSSPAYSADLWRLLARDVGTGGLVLPESVGGLGLGRDALVDAVREAGAQLFAGPLRSTLVAAWVLRDTDSEWRKRIADGAAATYATDLRTVPDGSAAEVVVHRDGGGISVGEPRARATLRSLDPSHDYAAVELAAGERHEVVDDGVEHLALAAEMVGGAEACVRAMAAYAGLREQFGEVIGAYQAVAHRCADAAVEVQAAGALLSVATAEGTRASALLARATAAEVFVAATTASIQVHGGIGFTWEHDAHLWFRRARSLRSLASPASLRRAALEAGALTLVLR